MKKILFNSSLPRSGSTLLQNILAQNPKFYASQTSGVIELLYAARKNYTESLEFKLKGEKYFDKAWLSFCRHGLEGFYEALTDKPICIDKSRSWIYYYDWLNQFYPNPKIIVCIRDLRSILSSMEKINRKNAHIDNPADIPSKMNFINIEQRVEHWMNSYPVGLATNRLRNSIQKGDDKNFHFIIYEEFTKNPLQSMRRLYDYIEEPYFDHNFEKIEQTVIEDDNHHGIYGDHKIKPTVQENPIDWDNILGKDLSNIIVQKNQWFYKKFY